jgi:hypothetical protein
LKRLSKRRVMILDGFPEIEKYKKYNLTIKNREV